MSLKKLEEMAPDLCLVLVKFFSEIGTEFLKNFIKNYQERKKNDEKVPEIPSELEEEIDELTWKYLEDSKPPVYMNGVIFRFQENLSDITQEKLRNLIRETDGKTGSCSKDKCTVYDFTNRYMGGEREKYMHDFGFDHNTLYLNFAQQSDDELYNDEALQEFVDALNRLLTDNKIEKFAAF